MSNILCRFRANPLNSNKSMVHFLQCFARLKCITYTTNLYSCDSRLCCYFFSFLFVSTFYYSCFKSAVSYVWISFFIFLFYRFGNLFKVLCNYFAQLFIQVFGGTFKCSIDSARLSILNIVVSKCFVINFFITLHLFSLSLTSTMYLLCNI